MNEKLSFTVLTDIDDSTNEAYRFGWTPTTLIVSPEGKVLNVWHGVYEDAVRKEIENKLKLNLPGCGEQTADENKTLPSATRSVTSSTKIMPRDHGYESLEIVEADLDGAGVL